MLNRRCRSNLVLAGALILLLVATVMTTSPAARSPRIATLERQAGPPAAGQRNSPAADQVQRGRYIVTSVARCIDCHTPRDERGNLRESRLLMGAPTRYLPAQPTSDWPTICPRIGGTPPATDEQIIRLLMTGVWKDGGHLRPPMPQFRMTREDAEAVLAFLKSLPIS
jgi:hypothetical protein